MKIFLFAVLAGCGSSTVVYVTAPVLDAGAEVPRLEDAGAGVQLADAAFDVVPAVDDAAIAVPDAQLPVDQCSAICDTTCGIVGTCRCDDCASCCTDQPGACSDWNVKYPSPYPVPQAHGWTSCSKSPSVVTCHAIRFDPGAPVFFCCP